MPEVALFLPVPACGNGIRKVERVAGFDLLVREARDRGLRTKPLDMFLAERAAGLAPGGTLVDWPFQARDLEAVAADIGFGKP